MPAWLPCSSPALGVGLVEITGGEPLLQEAVPELVHRLLEAGYEVLVETGGHRDISVLDVRAHAIVDVKCPGSRMEKRNRLENLDLLGGRDEVKFVLADRADYDYARGVIEHHGLAARVGAVLLSPVHDGLSPRDLAAWMLEDGLKGRLQVQLHKHIWPEAQRGV